jgi:CCR4-NOT transcriptional regulation complex NOT5 subunit
MNETEVKELIEYTQDLEGQVMGNTQSQQFSLEDKLTELTRDIFNSIKDIEKQELEHQRWRHDFHKPNYEQAIKNLKQYFLNFAKDNNFRL